MRRSITLAIIISEGAAKAIPLIFEKDPNNVLKMNEQVQQAVYMAY